MQIYLFATGKELSGGELTPSSSAIDLSALTPVDRTSAAEGELAASLVETGAAHVRQHEPLILRVPVVGRAIVWTARGLHLAVKPALFLYRRVYRPLMPGIVVNGGENTFKALKKKVVGEASSFMDEIVKITVKKFFKNSETVNVIVGYTVIAANTIGFVIACLICRNQISYKRISPSDTRCQLVFIVFGLNFLTINTIVPHLLFLRSIWICRLLFLYYACHIYFFLKWVLEWFFILVLNGFLLLKAKGGAA